jgi:hypothetical protein
MLRGAPDSVDIKTHLQQAFPRRNASAIVAC